MAARRSLDPRRDMLTDPAILRLFPTKEKPAGEILFTQRPAVVKVCLSVKMGEVDHFSLYRRGPVAPERAELESKTSPLHLEPKK